MRPSWIATHGNVGDCRSRGSSSAAGSSLSCLTRSRATSLRSDREADIGIYPMAMGHQEKRTEWKADLTVDRIDPVHQ